MVMAPNPYTGTDRPPTPEEQAALSRIAQMRAAGFQDAEIFGGGLAQSMNVGGGFGYLPHVADMAGIQSSYNLGRGNLALGAAQMGYEMQGDPYNVVSALQYGRDSGQSNVLTDPTLSSVPQSPMSKYLGFVDGLLEDSGGAGGGSATAPSAAGTRPSGQKMLPDITMNIDDPVQRVRNEVGDTAAMQGFQNFANFDAQRAAAPAPVPVAPTIQSSVAGAAFDPMATQRAAAGLLGNSGIAGNAIGERQLQAGNVPGFSSFSEREAGLMTPDQNASWMGLIGSTGRTSNPQAAYANYQRQYGHRGAGGAGRTIR